jgi:hypothetical protein
MGKETWSSVIRPALVPAAIAAAGIILIRVYVNDLGLPFWSGIALAAAGLWFLAAALGNIKNGESVELERVTGLRFKKSFFAVTVDSLDLEGERDGCAVTLVKTNGASKSAYTSEVALTFKGQAAPGFSLAIFPKGLTLRPFGFFPPALAVQPGWAEQHGLVLRGAPEVEAGAAAERLWRAASGGLPSGELRLLKLSGREMRAEFVKRDDPYSPGEVKRLLELCLKLYQARV